MAHLEVWYVQVDGVEDKKRKVLGRTAFRDPVEDPRSTALQTDDRIKRSFGQSSNDHVVFSFLPEPKELPSFREIRKGKIALATVRSQVIKDGIRLHPQNLKSGIGNKVKELNEIDPELNLTSEEAREFARELVDYAVEATFGPSTDYNIPKDYDNR